MRGSRVRASSGGAAHLYPFNRVLTSAFAPETLVAGGDLRLLASSWVSLQGCPVLVLIGQYDEAQKRAGLARERFVTYGASRSELYARRQEGDALFHMGRMADVNGLMGEGAGIARKRGDTASYADFLNIRGQTELFLGEYERAFETFTELHSIAESLGDAQLRAMTKGNLSVVMRRFGRLEEALEYAETALVTASELGDRKVCSTLKMRAGIALALMDENEKALEHFEDARRLAREIGYSDGCASAANNLGNLYQQMGELEKAGEQFEVSLSIARRIGDIQGEMYGLMNVGTLELDTGRHREAQRLLCRSLQMAKGLGDREIEAGALLSLGRVYTETRRVAPARAHLRKALDIYKGLGDRTGVEAVKRAVGELERGSKAARPL